MVRWSVLCRRGEERSGRLGFRGSIEFGWVGIWLFVSCLPSNTGVTSARPPDKMTSVAPTWMIPDRADTCLGGCESLANQG